MACSLGDPSLGALVTVAYDHLSGNREERRKLQREGSVVITPARELVHRLGPEGFASGTNEQAQELWVELFNKWWDELRPPLMVYLNQHPSARVRRLGEEFALSVGISLVTTRYQLLTRLTATTVDDYEAAVEKKEESLALADELFEQVRRRWPRLRR